MQGNLISRLAEWLPVPSGLPLGYLTGIPSGYAVELLRQPAWAQLGGTSVLSGEIGFGRGACGDPEAIKVEVSRGPWDSRRQAIQLCLGRANVALHGLGWRMFARHSDAQFCSGGYLW